MSKNRDFINVLTYSSLVSIQDSQGFWARPGFAVHDWLDAAQASRLHSYEGQACYMVRPLADQPG